jgi:hypothetical protein
MSSITINHEHYHVAIYPCRLKSVQNRYVGLLECNILWTSTSFFFSDWEKKLMSPQLRQQFEEKLTSMPAAESFYLLTTFANMAMARSNPADRSFVRAATLDLFQVSEHFFCCFL